MRCRGGCHSRDGCRFRTTERVAGVDRSDEGRENFPFVVERELQLFDILVVVGVKETMEWGQRISGLILGLEGVRCS